MRWRKWHYTIVFLLIFCLGGNLFPQSTQSGNGTGSAASGDLTSYVAAGPFNDDPNYAQVLRVQARQVDSGLWRFSVTLEHNDELLANGAEHYADRYQIINPLDKTVLGERILLHHHIGEMPFSRSISGVSIPEDLRSVIVRASCTHHGFGGREVMLPLLRY